MDVTDMPPTPRGRHHEIRGAALREFAGLRSDDARLDPHSLARFAKLMVVPFEAVRALSPESREHLLGSGKNSWSGGAASTRLPDGSRLIILNPTHGVNRQNATLMEEISHVFLGHKPSKLAVERRDRSGKINAREYDRAIEEEAYGTGAAALVPYSALKRMVLAGRSSAQIANHFYVSRALVEFRIKISRLWSEYKERGGGADDR
ncbi:MAG: ImmA/IrrE family metallo-endopeptidase [Acidobacteria bacterium]|nr:ImmA/IrrE family metallo-endopeptidase [Acidobacteriota bacterium]